MNNGRRKFLKLAGLTAVVASDRYLHAKTNKATKFINKNFSPRKIASETETRYAMVVDLKKCIAEKGCTKCIDICNKEHNIPDFKNRKDEVKWIWKEEFEKTFIDQESFYITEEFKDKKVPVFCNNCDEPPCVKVCPTQATFKREDGIVMMDWHRCIGCRYCMAACPYGSRSFNWKDPKPYIDEINPEYPARTKGVVEKCEFCDERISKGKLPACVEVCPVKALVFGNLNDPESEVRKLLKDNFSIRRKPGLGTHPEIYYLV